MLCMSCCKLRLEDNRKKKVREEGEMGKESWNEMPIGG